MMQGIPFREVFTSTSTALTTLVSTDDNQPSFITAVDIASGGDALAVNLYLTTSSAAFPLYNGTALAANSVLQKTWEGGHGFFMQNTDKLTASIVSTGDGASIIVNGYYQVVAP